MPNEIRVDYPSANLYACLRLPGGNVAYITGEVLEAWGTDDRTAADYAIALTYRGGSRHEGNIPSWLPANIYDRQVFLRSGDEPADTDSIFGSLEFTWPESKPYGKGIINAPGYVGDFKRDATIRIPWDTSGISPSTSGNIRVYIEGSTVEMTVPTGITDTRTFDGLAGINNLTIGLSANDEYRQGRDYAATLVGMVIDGQTVNAILGTWSIEKRHQGQVFRKDT